MAAPDSIWAALDAHAERGARSLEVVTLSMEGLFERRFRENPSARGVLEFSELARDQVENSDTIARAALMEFATSATVFGAQPPTAEIDGGALLHVDAATDSIRHHFELVRLQFVRKFRYLVASRLGQVPPLAGELRVLNRAGQAMRSRDFSLLTLRKGALDFFNDLQMSSLRSQGATEAQVVHRDAGHEDNGRRISLIDSGALPSYAEIADEIFHPRSYAVIGAV